MQNFSDADTELVTDLDRFTRCDRCTPRFKRERFVAMGVEGQHRAWNQIDDVVQRNTLAGQRDTNRCLDRKHGTRVTIFRVDTHKGVLLFLARMGIWDLLRGPQPLLSAQGLPKLAQTPLIATKNTSNGIISPTNPPIEGMERPVLGIHYALLGVCVDSFLMLQHRVLDITDLLK